MKRTTRETSWRGRLAAALPLLGAAALAQAGGHFEVDDAGTLGAGECQVEVWGGRATRSNVDFAHVGPSCGVGAVELGLNWDYTRTRPDTNLLGPQVKWTFFGREADASLSAALEGGAQYETRQGGRWGGQAMAVLSWQVLAPVQINANLGADWAPNNGEQYGRGGVQVQWAVLPQFTLVAERNHSFAQWGSRLGFSWQVRTTTSIDFSVARIGFNGGDTVYTVGVNHQFDFKGNR